MSHCVSCSAPTRDGLPLCRRSRCHVRGERWAAATRGPFGRPEWLLALTAADPAEFEALLGTLDALHVVLRVRLEVPGCVRHFVGAAAVATDEPSLARCALLTLPIAGVA